MQKISALLCFLFFVLFLIGGITPPVFASTSSLHFIINGQQIHTNLPYKLIDNRVFVPIRFVEQGMQMKVNWDNRAQRISMEKTDKKIEVTIHSKIATVNGKKKTLSTAPVIIGDRAYLPLRSVSELFEAEVKWDDDKKCVTITFSAESKVAKQSLQPVKILSNNALVAKPISNKLQNDIKPIALANAGNVNAGNNNINVFNGTFLFIWKADQIDNGDIDSMIKQARQLGITGVIIKFANGSLQGDAVSQSYMQQFKKLVGPFKAAGFKVGGWEYQYLTDVNGEVEACSEAIQAGADFIVLDGEKELEGKGAQVAEFGRIFRDKYPHVPVGFSSFAIADLHPEVPFDQYNTFVDVMMPQIYWADMGRSVDKAFTSSITSYKRFGKPIAPTGQSYLTAQPQDMKTFIQLCRDANFSSVSWWDWDEANQEQLQAIQDNPIFIPIPA